MIWINEVIFVTKITIEHIFNSIITFKIYLGDILFSLLKTCISWQEAKDFSKYVKQLLFSHKSLLAQYEQEDSFETVIGNLKNWCLQILHSNLYFTEY